MTNSDPLRTAFAVVYRPRPDWLVWEFAPEELPFRYALIAAPGGVWVYRQHTRVHLGYEVMRVASVRRGKSVIRRHIKAAMRRYGR